MMIIMSTFLPPLASQGALTGAASPEKPPSASSEHDFDFLVGRWTVRHRRLKSRLGRRTYDIAKGWGGSHPIHGVPVFVLSKDVPEKVPKGKSTFTFVTDGIISIVKQAKAAAGAKNVYVLGGANIAQQCLGSGLLDGMQIHLVPVLLGDGVRLFDHIGVGQIELERTRAIDSPGVSHLRFRVIK